MTMRSLLAALGVGVLALAGPAPVPAQVNPKNLDTAANPRPGAPATTSWSVPPGSAHRELWQLWKSLPGVYRETGEAPGLEVRLRAVSPYVLFAETRQGPPEAISVERGTVSLGDVSQSPTSPKMRFTLGYRPEALRSDFPCGLFGAPTPEGVRFETEGSDCSFALGRRVSKITIDASHGEIVLTEAKTGETLVLKRVADR